MRKQETLSSDKCPLTVERDGKSDLHAVMLSKVLRLPRVPRVQWSPFGSTNQAVKPCG